MKNRLRIIYFWCCATRNIPSMMFYFWHIYAGWNCIENIEVVSSRRRKKKSVIAICLWAKSEKTAVCFFFGGVFELLKRTQIICCNSFTIWPDGWRNFTLFWVFIAFTSRKKDRPTPSFITVFALARSWSWLNLIQRPRRCLTTPIVIERVNNRPQLVIYCRS